MDINQRVSAGWAFGNQCSGVLSYRRMLLTRKRKVYKIEIRPAKILCGCHGKTRSTTNACKRNSRCGEYIWPSVRKAGMLEEYHWNKLEGK